MIAPTALDHAWSIPYSQRSNSTTMGQQTNKIQKRRRRLDYLARRKAKTLAAPVSKPLLKKRPAPKKKSEGAPVAAAVETAPAAE